MKVLWLRNKTSLICMIIYHNIIFFGLINFRNISKQVPQFNIAAQYWRLTYISVWRIAPTRRWNARDHWFDMKIKSPTGPDSCAEYDPSSVILYKCFGWKWQFLIDFIIIQIVLYFNKVSKQIVFAKMLTAVHDLNILPVIVWIRML